MPALIIDPELIAAVTRQFNLRGPLQPFNLTENVVPVFDIGRLTGIVQIQKVATPDSAAAVRVGVNGTYLPTGEPEAEDGDIVNSDDTNPVATTVLADSGQLAAGVHLVHGTYAQDTGSATDFALEWRNAANSATLAVWRAFNEAIYEFGPRFLNFATNERIRFIQNANITGAVATTISSVLADPSVA